MNNNFVNAMNKETAWKETENGQLALNTTFNKCLDLFGTIGAMRERSEEEICRVFIEAFYEDKLTALKILFNARDIQEGLGERRTFRVILNWLGRFHPEIVKINFDNIAKFGRWDDFYALVETPVEDDMWKYIATVLLEDMKGVLEERPISLLAKWLKSTNASSKETVRLGKRTAKKLGISEKVYRQLLTNLRKYLDVVETKMSKNEWQKIDFTKVPGGAMSKYTKAFLNHDTERFKEYLNAVENHGTVTVEGKEVKAKINTKNLYPYELVRKYIKDTKWTFELSEEPNQAVEVMWKNLNDWIDGKEANVIVVADTSGSMFSNNYLPICSSVGLAIYFAERNSGVYHNHFINFSQKPTWQTIYDDETLLEKVERVSTSSWMNNTNLEAVFNMILKSAIAQKVSSEDLPKKIIIVTDMEFDDCTYYHSEGIDCYKTFYEEMKAKFELAGYSIPTIVFWNVNARNNTFHVSYNTSGVIIVSGQATTVFKTLLSDDVSTPLEYMQSVISVDRYNCIKA